MGRNRFVALDLECATSDVGNICEIGLVVMEDGMEVSKFRSLVRPVVEAFGDWQRWNFSYNLQDTLASVEFNANDVIPNGHRGLGKTPNKVV